MNEEEQGRYGAETLRDFTREVFVRAGLADVDAVQAADVLLTADLWGIDTHGVARLRQYYEMLARGLINPRPEVRVVRELAATATLDADNGLGLVVGPRAFETAMEKAERVGASVVGVRNSSHFGIAGYYPFMALARDLIGWAMTNTTPQVAPLWGAERMLGTNPLAVAFPGREEPPVLIDMATSAVSYGKVEQAVRRGEQVPRGWLIDREGRETTRPQDLDEGGTIVPLGIDTEHGGHKGYCLGALIDLLCGVLSGANWGPFVPPFPYYLKPAGRAVGEGIGHCFGALRIDGFADPDDFKRRVDEWVRVFRATRAAEGTEGPLIPGDPERRAHAERAERGIPLLPAVMNDLRELSARAGVPLPPPDLRD